ncbi:MAG: hypothetical protein H6873_02695 [Hyphomicrobiaceae bacterium]|nr:hypothetical protein [Hyphomicrobiaceae bacterium]
MTSLRTKAALILVLIATLAETGGATAALYRSEDLPALGDRYDALRLSGQPLPLAHALGGATVWPFVSWPAAGDSGSDPKIDTEAKLPAF